MEKAVEELVDREDIRACIARVARGEDRRDSAQLRSAYWDDAQLDFGLFAGNLDAYVDWVVPGAEVIANTQHIVAQSHIELGGNQAKVESHVISYHRIETGDDASDVVIGGRYLDMFEKREGEWRIAKRKMLYDWSSNWGEAADWAHGVMGAPLSDPRFTGRSHGDWSEEFFAAK